MRTSILLVAVAVLAIPAFAQVAPIRDVTYEDGTTREGTYTLGSYVDKPCTAILDRVYVDYFVDLYQEMWGADGRYLFDESTTMDSSTYAASGSSISDVGYKQAFTLRKYHEVNTNDDFHVVTVINFNPSTQSTSVTVETACGDGTPDSAQ